MGRRAASPRVRGKTALLVITKVSGQHSQGWRQGRHRVQEHRSFVRWNGQQRREDFQNKCLAPLSGFGSEARQQSDSLLRRWCGNLEVQAVCNHRDGFWIWAEAYLEGPLCISEPQL